jgi:hypothetical protein
MATSNHTLPIDSRNHFPRPVIHSPSRVSSAAIELGGWEFKEE